MSQITLTIAAVEPPIGLYLNTTEVSEWFSQSVHDHIYRAKEAGFDYALLLKASSASAGLSLPHHLIRIQNTSKVSDVISKARVLFAGFDQASDETWNYSYLLIYPILSNKPLSNSTRLSSHGVVDGELLVLVRARSRRKPLPHPYYSLEPVADLTRFLHMVKPDFASLSDPKYSVYRARRQIYGALLYTEDDFELATYVREHFDELHVMSGRNMTLFVVEAPPADSVFAGRSFWKSKLKSASYLTWSLLGWARTKPYSKSVVYEMAREIGVYPDQLPCLVLFDRLDRSDKIVIPIEGDYSELFRYTFSFTQRLISTVGMHPEYQAIVEEVRQVKARREEAEGHMPLEVGWQEEERYKADIDQRISGVIYNAIRQALETNPKGNQKPDERRATFVFHGQTVFINNPLGNVELNDFQNTKDFTEIKAHE